MAGHNARSTYWGHSANNGGTGIPEELRVHIERVATRAKNFGKRLGFEKSAELTGLLHDLGKYADQFQRRLRNPHIVPSRDHWSAGAIVACLIGQRKGLIPALAIEGHHTGLKQLKTTEDWTNSIARSLHDCPERFTESDINLLLERWRADGFMEPKKLDEHVPDYVHKAAGMLDTRMLFSCLVDADFLETEAHFEGDSQTPHKPRQDGPSLEPERALATLKAHIAQLAKSKGNGSNVHEMRQSLYSACLVTASGKMGVFNLSAPTGSGKTLSMLAFALRHAIQHRLSRIVLVMPFLSIIDQTAKTYRDLFSYEAGFRENYVLEDHSNAQTDEDSDQSLESGNGGQPRPEQGDDHQHDAARFRRLLSQNWDAPIILTTSVQCLESLMSNRPSACRKLHRLANSVVLFDEVQTLPPDLAVPTLATLARLSSRYRTSIVFATATQPAFDHLSPQVEALAGAAWKPREMWPDAPHHFATAAKRVRIDWRHRPPTSWEDLADEINSTPHRQVLCIVNLKRHAQKLTQLLSEKATGDALHLSTTMCLAHRAVVLEKVRQRLAADKRVKLVSTQCIEAGVDIDFPCVYRAVAPLESIAQAAGRCNRHGTRPAPGEVVVFTPMSQRERECLYPPGGYAAAANHTGVVLDNLCSELGENKNDRSILQDVEILQNPARLNTYFRGFYDLNNAAKIKDDLETALRELHFENVAREYRIIEQNAINVLVPYEPERALFEELKSEMRSTANRGPGWLRRWIQRARPLTVGLHHPRDDAPIWNHLEPVYFSPSARRDIDRADWHIAMPGLPYDLTLGLIIPEDTDLVC